MNLDLKSQEMKKFQENLKIGCRHSLVTSVQEEKQKFDHGTKKLKKLSIASPTLPDFVD